MSSEARCKNLTLTLGDACACLNLDRERYLYLHERVLLLGSNAFRELLFAMFSTHTPDVEQLVQSSSGRFPRFTLSSSMVPQNRSKFGPIYYRITRKDTEWYGILLKGIEPCMH
jgi:hypothetical protein